MVVSGAGSGVVVVGVVVSAISAELCGSVTSAEFAIEAGRPCRIGGKKRGASASWGAHEENKKTQSKVGL